MSTHCPHDPCSLSVVIVTRRRPEMLRLALESLARQTVQDFDVVVADNGPSDDTRELVESYAGRLKARYVPEPHRGRSHARNAGWQAAGGEYVAWLDDDARAAPDWIEEIRKVIAAGAPPIFGGPYYPFYLSRKPRWFRDEYGRLVMGDSPHQVTGERMLPGSNLVIRRDLIERVGGFSLRYGSDRGFGYGQDQEIQRRARRLIRGLAIWYYPQIVVEHLVRPEKYRLRWLLRQRWLGGRIAAHLDEDDGIRYPLLTVLRHLLGNAAAFAWLSVRGLWRDTEQYSVYEDWFMARVGMAVGGAARALERLRIACHRGRRRA